jgi:hypothetical protein
MRLQRLVPAMLSVALAAGCASSPPAAPAKPVAPVALGALLTEAEAANKAGQSEKALALLQGAASAFPADKAPWMQMAQLRFDNKNYGEAIVSGLAALERDPGDMHAYSLVAVSGLRVSSKALGDLTLKNNLTGTVRSEAHELAKLLRTSLGEEVLVPPRAPLVRTAAPRSPPKASPVTTPIGAKPTPCSGPFCSLN